MAKRKVRIDPAEKLLGDDYDDDNLLGRLSYLANEDEEGMLDYKGTAQPSPDIIQDFRDVNRNPSVGDSYQGFTGIPGAGGEYQGFPGLELLGQLAENESFEDSLDSVAETDPPQDSELDDDLISQFMALGDQRDPVSESMQEEDFNENFGQTPEALEQLQAMGDIEPLDEAESVEQSPPEFISPIDAIRSRIEQDPSLMESLPEATQKALAGDDDPLSQHQAQELEEMTEPMPGAVTALMNDPEAMETLRKYEGMMEGQGYPEEVKELAERWAGMRDKELSELDEEERALVEGRNNGTLNTTETIALGLAILAPTLLAMQYGKEAALGAIGGGLEAAANYIEKKEGSPANTKERLKQIQERKTDILDKDQKLTKEFIERIPDPKLKNFVKDKGIVTFEEFGKIGIPQMEELGVYLDASKFRNDEDYDLWRKEWADDREAFALQKEGQETLSEIERIFHVLEEQNPSAWNSFVSNFKGAIPKTLRDAWGDGATPTMEMYIGGELKKVNPLNVLSTLINKYQTTYIKQQNMGGRLTDNVKTHAQELATNPTDMMAFLSKNADDMRTSIQNLNNVLNRGFVETADSKGYLREPLKAQYPYSTIKPFRDSTDFRTDIRSQRNKFRDKVVR